jgi:hypothetical protein
VLQLFIELVKALVNIINDIVDFVRSPIQVEMFRPTDNPAPNIGHTCSLAGVALVHNTFVTGQTVIFKQQLAAVRGHCDFKRMGILSRLANNRGRFNLVDVGYSAETAKRQNAGVKTSPVFMH